MMKVVIIGATGATGSQLLQLLLADNTVNEIVALVRRPMSIENAKLTAVVIDFDQPELWAHLVTGDVAFSCLGTTIKAAGSKEAQYKVDYEYQYEFAKAARLNNIPKFILISAAMANTNSLIFYSKMKGQLEKSVSALGFGSLVIFRPGMLSRPGTQRRGEKLSEAVLNFITRLDVLKFLKPLPVKALATLMLQYAKTIQYGIILLGSQEILTKTEMYE